MKLPELKTECTQLQERFHELLVDPQTAPPELVAMWENHRRMCQDCSRIFAQMEQEQEHAEQFLDLLAYTPLSVYRDMHLLYLSRQRWKTFGSILAMAASLLLLAGAAIYMFMFGFSEEDRHPFEQKLVVLDEPDDKSKIATVLDICQIPAVTKVDAAVMRTEAQVVPERIVQDMFTHVQKIKPELQKLQVLAKKVFMNPAGRRKAAVPSRRLLWYMRVFLMNPANLQILTELEAQGYPPDKLRAVFAMPIHRMGHSEEQQKGLTQYCRQAAPVLLKILRERNLLRAKVQAANLPNVKDSREAFTLIEKIENFTIEF